MNIPTLLLPLLGASCILVDAEDSHPQHAHTRHTLNLPGRDDDRPYSHAVLAGDTLYVAGTIGLDSAAGR